MLEGGQYINRFLVQSAVTEWIATLSLIFGGCCSNAWALELATSQNPHAGTLITFAQFLLVSLYGLRKHLAVAPVSVARKALLRLLVFSILQLRSKKPALQHVYVAVEGQTQASLLFTQELVHEIKSSSKKLNMKQFSCTSDTGDVFSCLGAWLPDIAADSESVVFIHGPQLHTPASRIQWDYSIFLASSGDSWRKGHPSHGLVDSSLTVHIMTPTDDPVVIVPNPGWFISWNLFQIIPRLRFKNRSIPISRWAIQVVLFFLTSLLNNAAFGHNVPMAVHIIFRSGGLIINMLIGWLIDGRRYNATQIVSVMIVTIGVMCTTLSAQPSSEVTTSNTPGSYAVGIMILTLALVLSGFMGLAQDRTYAQYGRGHWQEAMFYLHFLALPGFAFAWRDLGRQVRTVHASTRLEVGLETVAMLFPKAAHMSITYPLGRRMPFAAILRRLAGWRLSIPSFYFPLLLNIATQLLCVSGVHRLTTRVNSLTVTLVLVVRKAVSVGISAMLFGGGRGAGMWLWIGASLVLTGTIGYTRGGSQRNNGGCKRDVKED